MLAEEDLARQERLYKRRVRRYMWSLRFLITAGLFSAVFNSLISLAHLHANHMVIGYTQLIPAAFSFAVALLSAWWWRRESMREDETREDHRK